MSSDQLRLEVETLEPHNLLVQTTPAGDGALNVCPDSGFDVTVGGGVVPNSEFLHWRSGSLAGQLTQQLHPDGTAYARFEHTFAGSHVLLRPMQGLTVAPGDVVTAAINVWAEDTSTQPRTIALQLRPNNVGNPPFASAQIELAAGDNDVHLIQIPVTRVPAGVTTMWLTVLAGEWPDATHRIAFDNAIVTREPVTWTATAGTIDVVAAEWGLGPAVFELTTTGGGAAVSAPSVPVTGGHHAAAAVDVAGSGSVVLLVQYHDADDNLVGQHESVATPLAAEPQRVTAGGQVPATAEAAVVTLLCTAHPSVLLWDAAVLIAHPRADAVADTGYRANMPAHNIIGNPNGDRGLWGWRVAAPHELRALRHSPVDPGDHGPDDWQHYPVGGGVAMLLRSSDSTLAEARVSAAAVPMVEGQHIAGLFDVCGRPGAQVRAIFWFVRHDLSIVAPAASPRVTLTGDWQTVHLPATPAPPGTAQVILDLRLYRPAGDSFPSLPPNWMQFRRVAAYIGDVELDVAGLPFTEDRRWRPLLCDSQQITVRRSERDVGLLSAVILNPEIDPAVNDEIRVGRKVRLRALSNAQDGVEWGSVFEGEITQVETTYPLSGTRVSISAADNHAVLANSAAPFGVETIGELGAVLAGVPVPFIINDRHEDVQPTNPNIVNHLSDATMLDQVLLTRDSNRGYSWIDRAGVLRVYDADELPELATQYQLRFSDQHDPDDPLHTCYTGIDVRFNTEDVINDLSIRYLVDDGVQTDELVFGPYRNEQSIQQWATSRAEVTLQGSVDPDAYAAAVLAAHATPQVRPQMVRWRVTDEASRLKAIAHDLFDLVHVTHTPSGLSAPWRVTEIVHELHPVAGWTITTYLRPLDTIAKLQGTTRPVRPSAETVDRSWQPLTLINGWEAWGGSFAPPSWRRDALGRIWLRGLLRGGASTANTTSNVFTVIPEGARPTHILLFTSMRTSTALVRVQLSPSGSMQVFGTDHSTVEFLPLDGISWTLDS